MEEVDELEEELEEERKRDGTSLWRLGLDLEAEVLISLSEETNGGRIGPNLGLLATTIVWF